MTNQTIAAQNIISSIETAVASRPWKHLMMEQILTEAQNLVNEEGYAWDNALCISCKQFPCTAHCGQAAYAK